MVLERRKFTLEEYHRLAETGFLGEDDRVELIDGEIIEMSPIDRRHSSCVNKINRKFNRLLGDRTLISIQNPIIILDEEPQPDIVVLKPNPNDYSDQDATANDALLIIEVANSSIAYDRDIKAPKYARANIPEFWIVDLNDELIWVYRNPSNSKYLDTKAYKRGETLTLLAFSDIVITVNEILGETY